MEVCMSRESSYEIRNSGCIISTQVQLPGSIEPVPPDAARVAAAHGCLNNRTLSPKRRLLVCICHGQDRGIRAPHGQSE